MNCFRKPPVRNSPQCRKINYRLDLNLHFDSFWLSTDESVLHMAQDNFMHLHPGQPQHGAHRQRLGPKAHLELRPPAHVNIGRRSILNQMSRCGLIYDKCFSQEFKIKCIKDNQTSDAVVVHQTKPITHHTSHGNKGDVCQLIGADCSPAIEQ